MKVISKDKKNHRKASMNDCSFHKRCLFAGLDSYLLAPPPPPPQHFQLETKPRNINIWHSHKTDNLNKNKIIHIWYGHEKGGHGNPFISDMNMRREVVITVTHASYKIMRRVVIATHSHLTQTWKGWSVTHLTDMRRVVRVTHLHLIQTWEGWPEWHIHIWRRLEKDGQSDTFTSDTDLRRVVRVTHSHLIQTWEGWSEWHIHIWHRLEKGGQSDTFTSDTDLRRVVRVTDSHLIQTWEGWSEWHVTHSHLTQTWEGWPQWHICIWHGHEKGGQSDTFTSDRLEKGGQSDTFTSDTDMRRVATVTHSYLTQTWEGWSQWHIRIWHRHKKGGHSDTFTFDIDMRRVVRDTFIVGSGHTFISDTDMRRVVTATHSHLMQTWNGWPWWNIHIWHRHENGGIHQ